MSLELLRSPLDRRPAVYEEAQSRGGEGLDGAKSSFGQSGYSAREGCWPASGRNEEVEKPGSAPPVVGWSQVPFPYSSAAWPSPLAGARQQPPHLPSAGPRPNQRRSLGGGCHVPYSALPISVAAANGLQGRGSGDRAPAGSPLARASRPPARFM